MKRRPLRARVGFAVAGLREAHARERSFRTHVRFAAAALLALLVLWPAPVWWALVAVTVALVLAFEMMNAALEGFIDLMHPGLHPEIKVAKDMAPGAVLVMSGAALVVGAAMVWSAGLTALARWQGWLEGGGAARAALRHAGLVPPSTSNFILRDRTTRVASSVRWWIPAQGRDDGPRVFGSSGPLFNKDHEG